MPASFKVAFGGWIGATARTGRAVEELKINSARPRADFARVNGPTITLNGLDES